jgi:hypothetical protein
MSRACLTIPILLILTGGFAASSVAQRNGLSLPPSTSPSPCNQPYPSSKAPASLLQYYAWLRSASSEEQATQYKRASSIASNGKPRGKLVLALTLILPEAPFADFERAAELLGDYLRHADKEDPEDRSLAGLLLTLLDKVARLEEQLDQLKAIEKDITETEQSVNVPAPAPAPAPAPESNDEHEEDDTSSR